MPKANQKDAFKVETTAEAYKSSSQRVPESVRKRLAELNEGDHISTKRQQ